MTIGFQWGLILRCQSSSLDQTNPSVMLLWSLQVLFLLQWRPFLRIPWPVDLCETAESNIVWNKGSQLFALFFLMEMPRVSNGGVELRAGVGHLKLSAPFITITIGLLPQSHFVELFPYFSIPYVEINYSVWSELIWTSIRIGYV